MWNELFQWAVIIITLLIALFHNDDAPCYGHYDSRVTALWNQLFPLKYEVFPVYKRSPDEVKGWRIKKWRDAPLEVPEYSDIYLTSFEADAWLTSVKAGTSIRWYQDDPHGN